MEKTPRLANLIALTTSAGRILPGISPAQRLRIGAFAAQAIKTIRLVPPLRRDLQEDEIAEIVYLAQPKVLEIFRDVLPGYLDERDHSASALLAKILSGFWLNALLVQLDRSDALFAPKRSE